MPVMDTPEYLRYTADQCRQLAHAIDRPNNPVVDGLLMLADEVEALIGALERKYPLAQK